MLFAPMFELLISEAVPQKLSKTRYLPIILYTCKNSVKLETQEWQKTY